MGQEIIYRGYTGIIEPDVEHGVLTGHVIDIRDEVYFEGKTIEELKASMKLAVDGYIETCEKIGKTPQRPYSGRLPLRMSPELHRRVHIVAESTGRSMNAVVIDAIEKAVSDSDQD